MTRWMMVIIRIKDVRSIGMSDMQLVVEKFNMVEEESQLVSEEAKRNSDASVVRACEGRRWFHVASLEKLIRR